MYGNRNEEVGSPAAEGSPTFRALPHPTIVGPEALAVGGPTPYLSGRFLASPLPWFPLVKQQSFYPRGNALTETMSFTDPDGVRWLVYIEGVPPDPQRRRWGQAALPGRRLRFDSVTESRMSIHVPAGSTYLTEERLQGLLDQTHPVPVAGPQSRAAATLAPPPPTSGSGARGERPVGAASEASRWRWRWASERAPRLLDRLQQFVSAVLGAMQVLESAIRSGPRRARR